MISEHISDPTTQTEPKTIQVNIADQSYQISYPSDKLDDLHQSAQLLDEKIRHIREKSNITNNERIAILAALNITHELLSLQRQHAINVQKIEELHSKIAHALAEGS